MNGSAPHVFHLDRPERPTPQPWHIAVLIPARNEEALLGRCLRSLEAALEALPWHVTSDVVVVADSSTDRTEQIAKELLRLRGIVVHSDVGCVGAARAQAADVALARYAGDPSRCWLANTDADCIVPADWLTTQLSLAERRVPAVAGIIDVDNFEDHNSRVPALFRLTYLLHEDGTHPHIHGANLGVRADAYLSAGGWQEQATAEDHDLWRRLRETGHAGVSDARLQVLTSGRRIGRAPNGFADALAAHNGAKA